VIIRIVTLSYRIGQKYAVAKPVILALVYRDHIQILKYDPKFSEILILTIDGATIFDTSGKLGEYPARSLYELSLNENRGSELVRITLMKNLHIPIYGIVDCRNRSSADSLSAATVFNCTGSKIEDRLYLGYVLSKVRGNISAKNLNDYNLLVPNNNLGGYQISSNVFSKLEFDFSSDMNIKDVISVEIEAPQGTYIPQYIDDIIKISGGRVVRTSNLVTSVPEGRCLIISGNKNYLNI
jgi:hypothetical protein